MNNVLEVDGVSGGLQAYIRALAALPAVEIVSDLLLTLTVNGKQALRSTTIGKSVGRVATDVLLEDPSVSRTHGFMVFIRFRGTVYLVFNGAPARNKFLYGYVDGQLYPRKNPNDPLVLPLNISSSTFLVILGSQAIGGRIHGKRDLIETKQILHSVRESMARYLMEMQEECILVPFPLAYIDTEACREGECDEPIAQWQVRAKRHYTIRRPPVFEGRFKYLGDFLLVVTSSYDIRFVANNGGNRGTIYFTNIDEISSLYASIIN
jgi:hypothetical protein